MKSDRTLRKWYRDINRRFFDGACSDDVCVRWANFAEDCEGCYGWTERATGRHKFAIVLSRERHHSPSAWLATLAHEMIHVVTEMQDGHGPAFEKWREFIAHRGIFRKHALHKNLTIF